MIVKDKQFYKSTVVIAIPIALQGMVSIANNMLDTIMVGSLGEVALSATSLASQIFFFLMILNFGLGGGAAVLSAQYWGKEDPESIRRLLSMVHKISLVMSLVFLAGAITIPETLLRIYTDDDRIIQQGIPFLRLVALMYPAFSLMTTSSIVMRTVGLVRIPFFANFISFFVNAFFNYMFIFGKFGAPALGVTGAAVGTLLARYVEFFIVYGYLLLKDQRIGFHIKIYLHWYMDIFKKYIATGINVLISDAFLAVGISALSMIMGRMGASMVAANSIANIIAQLSTILLQGLASASSIITGNTIGRGELKKAKDQGITFTIIGLLIGISGAGIILLLKPYAVSIYNVSDETKNIAYQILNAMAILIVFQSVSVILTKGVLRGGGDTKFLLLADILFLWIVSVPLGAYMGLIVKAAPGIVYICLKIDEVLKAIWCLFRLSGDKWVKDIT